MSKKKGYIEQVYRESTDDSLTINKPKESRGPYSKDQLIRQAINLNTKAFMREAEAKGKKMSEREARKLAIKVAENRDKRFG